MEETTLLLSLLAVGAILVLIIYLQRSSKRSPPDTKEENLDDQHQAIIDSAQRLTEIINESLTIVEKSKNLDTKHSRLNVAKEKLAALKQLSQKHPFIELSHLTEVEQSISDLEKESTQGRYREISEGNMRGKLLEKEGKTDEALLEYENLLKEGVDTPFPYKRLAIIYSKKKQPEEELRVLRAAINNIPIENSTHHQWFTERLEKKSGRAGSRKATSLDKQCEDLSIPLETVELSYIGKPEPALLRHYESLGYAGSYIEGHTLLTVLKALMLDKLTELNTFGERNDACTRYLEAQLSIHKEKSSEIINSIHSTTREEYLKNLNEILQQTFIKQEHPELSFSCCEALFDAIDTKTFIAVAEKFAEDPYTYRSGWPDLTLVKGKEVRFIEVKTTDKLHKSQLITIPAFRELLPYNFSVCRVSTP